MPHSDAGVPKVRSVLRAVAILNSFTDGQKYLTLSQIAQKTDLDRNTARRILLTLEAEDFIRYDPDMAKYGLGTGIYVLYPAVDYASNLREVAAPILTRLSTKLKMTSFVWTYLKGQALCVDRVRGGESLYQLPWTRVSTRIPLNSGAGPRVIMAHLPQTLRAEALAQCTGQATPKSRTNLDDLENDSEEIVKQGWELAVDDLVVGIAGLGVPIFSTAGEFAGSLSVSGAAHCFSMEASRPPQLDALLDAAAEIGFCLKSK